MGGLVHHLFWALMFLKTYSTSTILKHLVCVDEKTLMKWVRHFVLAIALLELQVVIICHLIFLLIKSIDSTYHLLFTMQIQWES